MKEEIVLSNDAFFLLARGEEPLDDLAYAEAEKIASRFPNGFTASLVRYMDNGLVLALFEHKVCDQPAEDLGPCLYFDATKYARYEVRMGKEEGTVKYRIVKNGIPGEVFTVPLSEGPHGLYFVTKMGSIIPVSSLYFE